MPASLPGWQAAPGPWNTATIGGVRVPGVVECTGRLSRRDDTADVPGQDGATQTVLGYAPAEFTITTQLFTDKDVSDFHALILKFRPTRADKNVRDAAARAVIVEHPAVRMCGLSQLTIYEITTPQHQGRQIHRATIQLREFIPEVKRTKTGGPPKGITPPKEPLGQNLSIDARTNSPSMTPDVVAALRAAQVNMADFGDF